MVGDGTKHLDETRFRIAALTQRLTFDHTSARRSSLPEGLRDHLMHDRWKPDFAVPEMRYALCNAHRLRELRALTELDGEAWAHRVQMLLRMAFYSYSIATISSTPNSSMHS